MTLALLLTAVTGAWASGEIVVTVTAEDLQADKSTTFTKDGVTIKCWDRMQEGLAFSELYEMSTTLGYFTKIEITNQHPEGISGINGISGFTVNGSVATWTGKASSVGLGHNSVGPVVQFVFTIEPAEPAIDFKWDPATKTGTFTMPAYDVEIAPIYAPVAQWAKVENVDQLPTAIEGIYAESTDAIVTAGTVAKIGETENVQGTVMYAVGTSATEQPALTAFSADVPTAKDITAAGDVYVWYYIKGADTPEGQTATAENTFNDSEICAEPIKVTVLSNKFDITFNAANDNTIEAGKATVTVGGTAATVTEGKLEGVKMGTEVKVTAKDGYKFRKVEAKKGGPTTTVTWSPVSCYGTYTQDGVTLTPSNGDAVLGNNFYQFGDNTFTTTLGKFIKIEIVFESTTYTFDGWTMGTAEQYQPDPHTYPDWWKDLLKLTWTGNADSVTIKGKDVFGIHRITFTIQ